MIELKYKIVSATSANSLMVVVTRAISNGWVPTGGVAFAKEQYSSDFYQSMIKEVQTDG